MTLRRFFASILALALSMAALAPAALAQGALIERRPVEDPLFAVSSVIPDDWQELGGGAYARGTPPEDLALIVIQSAAATEEQLWQALLPQTTLSEVPDVGGTYVTDRHEWTLYPFEVELGEIVISAEVALAEEDGKMLLVLLQSDSSEYEALREQVLLPALDAFAPLAPEPTPDPSTFDYQIEEVTFPGGAEDVMLSGTLTTPLGPGPHPVVITMSGSGPSDRDESLVPITLLKPFAEIAHALTSAGVGVLRYDDRGVGESTGVHEGATIVDFTEDARAAIAYLETRDEIDPERIGLFAHSEGGFYASKLGASDPRVAFIAMMAPASVDGIELIVAQNGALLRAAGASEEYAAAAQAFAAEVMPVALEGDAARVGSMVRDYYGDVWDRLDEDERAVAGERQAYVARTAAPEVEIYTSDWFRSFLAYDPSVDWAQVRVPVLAVFAEKDAQVLAEQNASGLRAALETAGNEDFEITTIAEANHLFQRADTGAFAEYGQLEPEFIDGFLDTLVEWISVRAGVADPS